MVKKYSEITHIFNEHMKGGDGTVEVIPSVYRESMKATQMSLHG